MENNQLTKTNEEISEDIALEEEQEDTDAWYKEDAEDDLPKYCQVAEEQDIDLLSGSQLFYKNTSEIKLLTQEEEIELGKKLIHGTKEEQFEARQTFIMHNLGLVKNLACRMGLQEFDDKVQDGILGLIKAATKYDYRKGCRFSTYATHWIRQSIERQSEAYTVVRYPTYIHREVYEYNKWIDDYERQQRRQPTNEEFEDWCKTNKINPELIKRARSTMNPMSLDKPINDNNPHDFTTLVDFVVDDNADIEKQILQKELQKELDAAMDMLLSDREKFVVSAYFGLNDFPGETLESIGEKMHITRERVRQLIKKSLKSIRMSSRTKHLEDFIL